jgi:hypothetical protein
MANSPRIFPAAKIGGMKMKKFISMLTLAAIMAVMVPVLSGEALAQRDCYYNREGRYVCRDEGNIYDRHRNIINVGIGTGAGAIIGGLIGGKRGALIGAAAGAGGAALYTYKINPKSKKYQRYYNRR